MNFIFFLLLNISFVPAMEGKCGCGKIARSASAFSPGVSISELDVTV